MADEAKLGLVAGVLAVVGVAVFGQPKDAPKPPEHTVAAVGTASTPPNLPPAAVIPAQRE